MEIETLDDFADAIVMKLHREIMPMNVAGVPPGRYAVKCFQDTNGNRKLDIGMFGPKEPWAVHRPARPKLRPPRFEEMAFELTRP